MRFVPGLALAGALAALGFALSKAAPVAGALLWALALGALAAPLVGARPAAEPGVRLAATTLLRAGVALLGLRISLGVLGHVGLGGAIVAAGTLSVTLAATILLGRWLGIRRDLALLIATGSAICGASAIAAMNSVTRADEEDVGYAVATVTLFGSLAMLLLPPVAAAIGLSDARAGVWAGASVHEVAQATAAGSAVSLAALKAATLVKLTRVILLAPAVSTVAASRRAAGAGAARVPGFVLAFLGFVALRSLVTVPAPVLAAAGAASTLLLAAALAALGLRIRLSALRAAGLRPLALGLAAWLIAAATALTLVLAVA
jgi:uncharacterized integral membrane protein (TIGR00698 family)